MIAAIADWVRAMAASSEWLSLAAPVLAAAPDWALVLPAPIVFAVIAAWSVGRAKKATEEAIDTLREGAAVLTGGAIQARPKAASADQVKELEARILALTDAQRAQVAALESKLDQINQSMAAAGATSVIVSEERQRRNIAVVDIVSEDSAGAREFTQNLLVGGALDFGALKEEARSDTERAAAKWRRIAAVAHGVSDGDALAALEEVNKLERGDFWTLVELSGLYSRFKGDLVAASAAAAEAKEVARTDWERASAHDIASDILRLRGDLAGAQREAEAGLAIRQKIVDAGDASGIANVAVSRSNLANILGLAGKLDEATSHYDGALEIAENLASGSHDFQIQHSLWVSRMKLADMLLRKGEIEEAKPRYEEAYALAQRLAVAAPEKTTAKRSLLLSVTKLGEISVRKRLWADARPWFEEALARAEELAQQNPNSAEAVRDLSVSANKMGLVLLEQGELDAARARYEQALKLRERLAALDVTNLQAQNDYSIALENLADLEMLAGDLERAKNYANAAVEISERIAALHPDNMQAQRDFADSLTQLGDVLKKASDSEGAGVCYKRSLAIIEQRLAGGTGDNTEIRRDLIGVYAKIARVCPGEGWWARAQQEVMSLAQAGKLPENDAWMIADTELKAAADVRPETPAA